MLSCRRFFFKQRTAYERRSSDWSSDVCSSDLASHPAFARHRQVMAAATCRCRPVLRGEHRCRRALQVSAGLSFRRLLRCAVRPLLVRKRVVSGKSVSVLVDLGGSRIIKKKKQEPTNITQPLYMRTYCLDF